MRGFREAVAWEAYEGRRYRWDLTRALVQTQGGRLDEYPDYVPPDAGELDPEEIERALDAAIGSGGVVRA